MAKIFPIDFEEKNTIAQDDYILFSDSEDGDKIKKAQYSNLKGEKGDTGTAATVSVGTTTTGAAGTSASVTNVGTSGAAVFNFTIPKGDKGDTGQTGPAIVSAAFNGDDIDFTEEDGNVVTLSNAKTDLKGDKGDTGLAATISVGTTTTLDAGDNATVTNSGTSSAAVFNFGIPKGDTGDTGATGNGIASISSTKAGKTTTVTITETNGDDYSFQVQDGADGQGAGDVTGPASSTDGNIAVFDGNTGKIIKDSGVAPTVVVDALNSSSTTSALSANQGKVLNDKISDLMGLGKFLSLWDATTGLPDSFPLETPYTYTTGDYFLVETVSSATPPVNYRPTGSSYNGTASSTTESDELEAGDVYIYDGTTWLLQSNHGKTVSFSNIAGDAMDNANLSGYLNMKAFYLSSTSDLTNAQKAFEWQNGGKTAIVVYNSKPYAFLSYNTAQMTFACLFYREQAEASNDKTSLVRDVITLSITGGTTVSSISANARNNIIASVLKTDTDYATPYTPQYDGSPATKKYVDDKSPVVSSSTPSTPTEGMLWYDTINDALKAYNGSSWDEIGGGITKIFTLSSTSDLVNAQAAYDRFVAGGNPILKMDAGGGNTYVYNLVHIRSDYLLFSKINTTVGTTNTILMSANLKLAISSGSITSITSESNKEIVVANSVPTSAPDYRITLVK